MTPETRARTRRRRFSAPPVVEVEEEAAPPLPEPSIPEAEATPAPEIIDTTATVIAESVEPLVPEPPSEAQRTDFYFPPLPRPDRSKIHARVSTGNRRARQATAKQRMRQGRRGGSHGLRALGRGIRRAAAGSTTWFRGAILPILYPIWRWLTHDPYAPPREGGKQALLQGRVLGVYRYYRYQRMMLSILGGVPLGLSCLYILLTLSTTLQGGVNSPLFLIQDLAGAAAGFFGSLMLLKLASLRITLRSDGIEYKTMFRVVRSRWNEIGVLKVEYFRRSERWVVGTGRGAWAFLYRSLLGLPKGRQLAKLITIYARLSATGTPYWLPGLERFSDTGPIARAKPTETPEATQQVPL